MCYGVAWFLKLQAIVCRSQTSNAESDVNDVFKIYSSSADAGHQVDFDQVFIIMITCYYENENKLA